MQSQVPDVKCMMEDHAGQHSIQFICSKRSCSAPIRLMCAICLRKYHSGCSLQYLTYDDVRTELQQLRNEIPVQQLRSLINNSLNVAKQFKHVADYASQFLYSFRQMRHIEILPQDPQFWAKAQEKLIEQLHGEGPDQQDRKIAELVARYQTQVDLALDICPIIKSGRSTEINEFHSSLSEEGQYEFSAKNGKWKIFDASEREIGGGQYNFGEKTGQWKEPNKSHLCYQEIGRYSSNGLRNGEWTIVSDQDRSQIYGGGKYEDGIKVGYWNEPSSFDASYFDSGNYSLIGKRVGEWKIHHIHDNSIDFLGGVYNNQGLKIGQWSELNEQIVGCKYYNKGSYNQAGLKHGKWSFVEIEYRQNVFPSGEYIDGVKRGKWFEPNIYSNVYFDEGQYTNDFRDGEWFITNITQNHKYKAGKYINKAKIGLWIEPNAINDKFKDKGEYNEQSKRCQEWIIFDIDDNKYGGGFYQNGEKVGNWVEPHVSKKYFEQGTYMQNQMRNGEWIIFEPQARNSQNPKKIFGRGIYQSGVKQGQWIEPTEQVNIFETCSYNQGGKLQQDIRRNPRAQLN